MVLGKKNFGVADVESTDSPQEDEYASGDIDLPEELDTEMQKDTPPEVIDHKKIGEIKQREKDPIGDTDSDKTRDLDINRFTRRK